MSEASEAPRHTCGFFIAQHGRQLPAGLWEHSCAEIGAIHARFEAVQSARSVGWVGRVRLRLAALTTVAR